MKVLIDTHIAIWAILDDPKLSPRAREILQDESNEIYYSSASVWEITIKHLLHPNKVMLDGTSLAKGCEDTGFEVLPVYNRHVFMLESLKRPEDAPRHNDPFDRILIAQAKAEGMRFLTHDSLLPYYNEPCLIFAG